MVYAVCVCVCGGAECQQQQQREVCMLYSLNPALAADDVVILYGERERERERMLRHVLRGEHQSHTHTQILTHNQSLSL